MATPQLPPCRVRAGPGELRCPQLLKTSCQHPEMEPPSWQQWAKFTLGCCEMVVTSTSWALESSPHQGWDPGGARERHLARGRGVALNPGAPQETSAGCHEKEEQTEDAKSSALPRGLSASVPSSERSWVCGGSQGCRDCESSQVTAPRIRRPTVRTGQLPQACVTRGPTVHAGQCPQPYVT